MLWGLDLKARASEFRTSSFGLRGLASPVAPPAAGPRHNLEGFLAATDMLRVASPARVQPAGFERHVVFQPSQQPHVHVGRLVFGPGRATGSSQRITFAKGAAGGGRFRGVVQVATKRDVLPAGKQPGCVMAVSMRPLWGK